ncbi:MAG: hypothetical protein KatS3mg032_0704 [Cyclobacteriaceae bacterium]|nr:MAG: hypothetical protein KatS3mg032_0704 [Cyclobacteriaceae bacterium]
MVRIFIVALLAAGCMRKGGAYREIARGTTIGYKRIFITDDVITDKIAGCGFWMRRLFRFFLRIVYTG